MQKHKKALYSHSLALYRIIEFGPVFLRFLNYEKT
ncbi:MAG: hypothetical protein RL092_1397 [Bacteroidota bacterium]|jgi:hypothetical protein